MLVMQEVLVAIYIVNRHIKLRLNKTCASKIYSMLWLDDFNFRIDNTKLEYIFEAHVLFNRNLMCLFTIYIATNTS
jgi:hypothetical protein